MIERNELAMFIKGITLGALGGAVLAQLLILVLAVFASAGPLRMELHLLGVTHSYQNCPSSGNVDCDLANHILGSGCALVPAQNHDVGTWEVYDYPMDVFDATGQGTTQDLTFGIADCGTLLRHDYYVFLLVQGAFSGGPGEASAMFTPEDPAGGFSRFGMQASITEACTEYLFEWHDASKGLLQYGADSYAQVMTIDGCLNR